MNDDTGFRPDHLVTLRFAVPTQITGEARNTIWPRTRRSHLSQMPEVESAAVTFVDPFVWGGFGRGFTLEDHESLSSSEQDSITYQEAGPDYFHTMGIPIVRGREFSNRDSLASPHVVMVNNAFAKNISGRIKIRLANGCTSALRTGASRGWKLWVLPAT